MQMNRLKDSYLPLFPTDWKEASLKCAFVSWSVSQMGKGPHSAAAIVRHVDAESLVALSIIAGQS